MNTKGLAVGLGIVLMLVMGASLGSLQAAAPFAARASGSYVSPGTQINTNGDNKYADLVILGGKSNLGEITMQAVIEWAEPFGPTTCDGVLGFEANLVMVTIPVAKPGSGFVIRMANGDLAYGEFTGGTNCYDVTANSAIIDLTGTFTGGTGKFLSKLPAGTISVQGTVVPVIGDERLGGQYSPGKFGHQFGTVDATITGTLP